MWTQPGSSDRRRTMRAVVFVCFHVSHQAANDWTAAPVKSFSALLAPSHRVCICAEKGPNVNIYKFLVVFPLSSRLEHLHSFSLISESSFNFSTFFFNLFSGEKNQTKQKEGVDFTLVSLLTCKQLAFSFCILCLKLSQLFKWNLSPTSWIFPGTWVGIQSSCTHTLCSRSHFSGSCEELKQTNTRSTNK